MLTKRQQKRTMIRISISMIPLAVMIGLTLTQNLGVSEGFCSTVEEIPIEESATQGKGQIRCLSGMPCENREQFMRWYEEYEQKTSEEDADEVSNMEMGEEVDRYSNRQKEADAEILSNAEEMETAQSDNVRGGQSEVVYSVNGEMLNPEQFERWYAEYEQETSEEAEERPYERTAANETAVETRSESFPEEEDDAKVETDIPDSQESVDSPSYSYPLYTVNGELIDPTIQQKLHDALEKHGIGYWYEGALCQMYQESRGNPTIVNSTNGVDMGLFQYREPFWDYSRGDIFDPEAQIELYVEETETRINAGLTVDEVISRHFTSDYVTEVDWEYVEQVKQWLPTMKGEN